jgi:hypothetical protein
MVGIPHFFVLEKDGTLLYSQHVVELRKDGQYNPGKMWEFLVKWSSLGGSKSAPDDMRDSNAENPAFKNPPLR